MFWCHIAWCEVCLQFVLVLNRKCWDPRLLLIEIFSRFWNLLRILAMHGSEDWMHMVFGYPRQKLRSWPDLVGDWQKLTCDDWISKPSFFVWLLVLVASVLIFTSLCVIMRRGTQQWHEFLAHAIRSCTASNPSCICMTMWCRFTAFFESWCCCNVNVCFCVSDFFDFCSALLAGTYEERNGWPYPIFSSSRAVLEPFEFFGCILIVTLHYAFSVCALYLP